MNMMRNLFLLVCLTICLCQAAKLRKLPKDDPKLIQATMQLKKQALKVMKMRGVKVGKVNIRKEATWGDIKMNWALLKNLKAKYNKEKKRLENSRGGKFEKLTAPDFDVIPFAKWTDMPIRYTLKHVKTSKMRSLIHQALREIEDKIGCISFQEYPDYPPSPFIAYVEHPTMGGSCGSSNLGKQPQVNQINVATDCPVMGTMIHETLHSLGFAHTQSRPDADQYLTIHWYNIQEDAVVNFEPWGYALRNQGPFDYGSIMMYPKNAFAKNPYRDTLTPKIDPERNGRLMGQRDGLSNEDINIVRKLYCNGNSGGSGRGNRPSGGVSSRTRPTGGITVENHTARKINGRTCWRQRVNIIRCTGFILCDQSGTYRASCRPGLYSREYNGKLSCVSEPGECAR